MFYTLMVQSLRNTRLKLRKFKILHLFLILKTSLIKRVYCQLEHIQELALMQLKKIGPLILIWDIKNLWNTICNVVSSHFLFPHKRINYIIALHGHDFQRIRATFWAKIFSLPVRAWIPTMVTPIGHGALPIAICR